MTSFYAGLLAANVFCFLPLYLFNFRHSPNPLEFLLRTENLVGQSRLRVIYDKPKHTDPFRINLEYTVLILVAAAQAWSSAALVLVAAVVLAFGFVEVAYTSLMHSVFKRPPAVVSDLSLLKAGLSIAQRHRYWLVPVALAALGAVLLASYWISSWLLGRAPIVATHGAWAAALAVLVALPGLYHWRSYAYTEYQSRTVYSPLLHFYRNLDYSRRVRAIMRKSAEHFAQKNDFKDVVLVHKPRVITICVESYGAIVYRQPEYGAAISRRARDAESRLAALGYGFASTYSEPPIFAGGSWLSYASLTYGFRLDDLQLFDGLFSCDTGFASYESLFHVLKRNGYRNFLLCPLGGIDSRSVDWSAIDRCFQADRTFDFASVPYSGPLVNYFGVVRRYAPPDQYSLNFAYGEAADLAADAPFSMFFCTLNSHYPWQSPAAAVEDWRALNTPALAPPSERSAKPLRERYRDAVGYQLDYIFKFIADHAADDLIVVVFGDHQPPLITPESMGKQTPLHVIARDPALLRVLLEHGFVPSLDLAGEAPASIKHEGFLSLFMQALNAAHGAAPELRIPYRQNGAALFEEVEA